MTPFSGAVQSDILEERYWFRAISWITLIRLGKFGTGLPKRLLLVVPVWPLLSVCLQPFLYRLFNRDLQVALPETDCLSNGLTEFLL